MRRPTLFASLVLLALLGCAVPAEAAPRAAERVAAIDHARSAPRIAFGGIILLACFCLVIRRSATQ